MRVDPDCISGGTQLTVRGGSKGRGKGKETGRLQSETQGQEARRLACYEEELGVLESEFKVMDLSPTRRASMGFQFSKRPHWLVR